MSEDSISLGTFFVALYGIPSEVKLPMVAETLMPQRQLLEDDSAPSSLTILQQQHGIKLVPTQLHVFKVPGPTKFGFTTYTAFANAAPKEGAAAGEEPSASLVKNIEDPAIQSLVRRFVEEEHVFGLRSGSSTTSADGAESTEVVSVVVRLARGRFLEPELLKALDECTFVKKANDPQKARTFLASRLRRRVATTTEEQTSCATASSDVVPPPQGSMDPSPVVKDDDRHTHIFDMGSLAIIDVAWLKYNNEHELFPQSPTCAESLAQFWREGLSSLREAGLVKILE